jgi:hypothetical protein
VPADQFAAFQAWRASQLETGQGAAAGVAGQGAAAGAAARAAQDAVNGQA